ncbi:chymotrypsin inhibitor-like [Solenopsis invicta]|uniref:chymotrypsin inhibitor-like n=1 Tax=Solenopsis invicta TaxID=13686 RepID=UPI00193E0028|nr:chymotrypsin inhibitor-like [Solenopsis invicta]
MSHASFVLLVTVGVLCSMTAAQEGQCALNEEWTNCGTACPQTCDSPPVQACTANCVVGCQCREGYVLNNSGQCVLLSEC